jgi:S1-C subfamily serine protease
MKIDESRVGAPREISSTIRSARAKRTVPVQIMRERREMNLTMSLEDLDAPQAMPGRSIKR